MRNSSESRIRVLVADDDSLILRCYDRAFSQGLITGRQKALDLMSTELFGSENERVGAPAFELVPCSQGEEALDAARDASAQGTPFDVVILDIRMPPGINGVETAERIRRFDSEVPIVFVSGYSDVSEEELRRRVPPPSRVRFYKKPLNFRNLALDVTGIVCEIRSAGENEN